jgi:hypothetical protein
MRIESISTLMTGTLETIVIYMQLVLGIAALLWYPYEIGYRFYYKRRLGIGYWEVDTPVWHKIIFWPIIIGLFLIFTWRTFF